MRNQVEQMKSSKNPAMAGYLLKEGYTIKPHDSANIKKNIQEVEMIIKDGTRC